MHRGMTTWGQREKTAMYNLTEFAVHLKLTKYYKSTMKVKVLVAQSCSTLSIPWTVTSVQAKILEWVAIPFSRGSSQPRNQTWVSALQAESLPSELPVTQSCAECSVTQFYSTLWDPMDCSTSGIPVLHHLLEHAQTHIHWVGDAIQSSHPLSSPSPPAFSLS